MISASVANAKNSLPGCRGSRIRHEYGSACAGGRSARRGTSHHRVFGQTLPPRMISSLKLITGSLPAEYGLRSAGIIDLTTKSGALHPGGSVAIYGGSHGSIEPSVNYGGSSASNTYFATGDFIRNGLGIESPDGRSGPLHH